MSERKGTQYERTRGAILLALFNAYEGDHFSRLCFERTLDKIGIGDERTVRKYWKKLSDMGYIRQINASSARLSDAIIENEGHIEPPDGVIESISVPEAVR
jgi:hypothetical protein